MVKRAEYIQEIEIKALWGRKHIYWRLRPDVNILSGINGVGKTTILNRSISSLDVLRGGEMGADGAGFVRGVRLKFFPEDATGIRYDVIRSFDRPLIDSDKLAKLADKQVKTELDWQIYQLQRRFLNYQVDIGKRIISMFTDGMVDETGREERVKEVFAPKIRFQDILDELFKETGKRIDRTCNEVRFIQSEDALLSTMGKTSLLSPYQLSSGEKQMLVILLTTLVEDNRPGVLFMDEPEVSLHIDWQRRLIALVRELNPNVQIILTTHSPAVIMDGWMDKVCEVTDITEK